MKNKLTAISSKGFTLVELLVVIGIIGLLAAVLMATIDPIEQFKKTQDSNSKNMAVDFANAAVRYYSTHNSMPWTAGIAGAVGTCTSGNPVGQSATVTQINDCMKELVNDGELKASFTSVTNTLKNLLVTGDASNVVVCFIPTSKSQKLDSNTKWDSTGTNGATTHWCAK